MTSRTEDLSPQDAAHSSDDQPPVVPTAKLNRVFFGFDGLRPVWSLLIFCVLLGALLFAGNAIGRRLLPPPSNSAAQNPISFRLGFIVEAIPFLAVLLVTWIMSKIERRPNSVYGFGGSRRLHLFFSGLAWGLACLSLLVFVLRKTGLLIIENRLLFGPAILGYGALWFLGFLLVGLLEEYLNRGYLQFTLSRVLAGFYQWAFKATQSAALGFWTAALLISILFGLGHGNNPGESPIGLLSAGLGGLVFCFSLWRTGSLWWAIGFHTAWDWAQSFLYGVADSGLMVQHRLLATHPAGKPLLSGGTTGPEGSILIVGILAIIVLVIFYTVPRISEDYASKLATHSSALRTRR